MNEQIRNEEGTECGGEASSPQKAVMTWRLAMDSGQLMGLVSYRRQDRRCKLSVGREPKCTRVDGEASPAAPPEVAELSTNICGMEGPK